jgi:hypothetical protein
MQVVVDGNSRNNNYLLPCSYLQFEAFLGDLMTESGHVCSDVLTKNMVATRRTF